MLCIILQPVCVYVCVCELAYYHYDILLCSYFLYCVSHPDRHGASIMDLSTDENVQIVSSKVFTAAQMKLE